tara:strand:+ start:344 stop:553 length:210 start_codon:yes stop_codon:yes gene_type:complete
MSIKGDVNMKWEKLLKENIDKNIGLIKDLELLVETWRPETEEGHAYKKDLQDIINKWGKADKNIHTRWN